MDSRHWLGLYMLLSASVVSGCGPARPVRVPVHGQVTVNGEAGEAGLVRFVPIGEDNGPKRAVAKVAIVNGEYQVETGGGLPEGRYRVEVEVQRKTGKKITKRVVGSDMAEVDEIAVVSSPRHAGKDSPLEYMAQGVADARFDIDVPEQ